MAHVLAVDDDIQLLKVLRQIAERSGCTIETVNGAGSFMKAFVRQRPDVVMIDLVMPDVDGIELIGWLKDVGCDSRVIVTSGEEEFLLTMAATLARANSKMQVSTLRKPFRASELSAALHPGA